MHESHRPSLRLTEGERRWGERCLAFSTLVCVGLFFYIFQRSTPRLRLGRFTFMAYISAMQVMGSDALRIIGIQGPVALDLSIGREEGWEGGGL